MMFWSDERSSFESMVNEANTLISEQARLDKFYEIDTYYVKFLKKHRTNIKGTANVLPENYPDENLFDIKLSAYTAINKDEPKFRSQHQEHTFLKYLNVQKAKYDLFFNSHLNIDQILRIEYINALILMEEILEEYLHLPSKIDRYGSFLTLKKGLTLNQAMKPEVRKVFLSVARGFNQFLVDRGFCYKRVTQ